MKHPAHRHLLILNEQYIAEEGDVCIGCYEQIDSCKSFVYSCSRSSTTSTKTRRVKRRCVKFLLHKTCAELPPTIANPTDQKEFLVFHSVNRICETYEPKLESPFSCCNICGLPWRWFSYCSSSDIYSYVCFRCVLFLLQQSKEDPKLGHPGHNHPLALIQHPCSFKCYACRVNDNILDLSYRCTKCQFWLHKSCGDAPASFQFQFHHKHPLILEFFLPQVYRKFTQYCRICSEALNWIEWLYCCRSCRFFTHFQCARSRSSPLSSFSENEAYPNVVYLPPGDELSLNLLLEQFVKDTITLYNSCNNNSIFSTTNYIKHWAHEEHDLKLITINELDDWNNDDEILLLCDGCVKPIRTDGSLFYGCVPCKYFMHKVCAELPREIENHHWSGKTLFANKYSDPFNLFECYGCYDICNGIFYGDSSDEHIRLHIGCVTLPNIIKHEAHRHQLHLVLYAWDQYHVCNACGSDDGKCRYRCEECDFYTCARCIMKARILIHKWDRHPLDLIYDAGMVMDHEHDFDCEYCSKEINTNNWFYHCSFCDLSFHLECLQDSCNSRWCASVKFRDTDIIIDKLHPHRLKFVLNKMVRTCEICKRIAPGEPVLKCAPCGTIFCQFCY